MRFFKDFIFLLLSGVLSIQEVLAVGQPWPPRPPAQDLYHVYLQHHLKAVAHIFCSFCFSHCLDNIQASRVPLETGVKAGPRMRVVMPVLHLPPPSQRTAANCPSLCTKELMQFLRSEVRNWVKAMHPIVPSTHALGAKPQVYVKYGDGYLNYVDLTCSDDGPRYGAGRGPQGGPRAEEDGRKRHDWDEAWRRVQRQRGDAGEQKDRDFPSPEERPAENDEGGAVGREAGQHGAGGSNNVEKRRCSELVSSKWFSWLAQACNPPLFNPSNEAFRLPVFPAVPLFRILAGDPGLV